MIVVGNIGALAGEEVISFSADTDKGSVTSNGQTSSGDQITKSGVTIFSSNGCLGSGSYRVYTNGNLSISTTEGNITKVEITCNGTTDGNKDYNPNKFTLNSGSTGSYSGSGYIGTWTGEATSVVLDASAQVRMTKIKVTIETEETDAELHHLEFEGSYPTLFAVGDEFSYEGLTVWAVYTDETKKNVTTKATYSLEKGMDYEGTQMVSWEYAEDDTSVGNNYQITTVKLALSKIEAETTKKTFFVGDEFTTEGLTVMATYTDERVTLSDKLPDREIDVTDKITVVSSPDMSTVGTFKEVKVSYTDGDRTKTAFYYIDVVEAAEEATATGNLNNSSTGVFAGKTGYTSGEHSVSGTLVTDAGNVTIEYAGTQYFYLNGTHIRMYKNGSTLKFTAPTGYTLTKIVLTKTQSDGGEYSHIKSEQGSYSSGTWTGDEEYVTFTGIGDDGGTVRLASAEVTLEKAGVKYSLTLSDTENGTVTIKDATGAELQSGVKLKEGTEVTIEASPAAGYLFDGWTSTPDGVIDDATSATATLTMPAGDVTLSASFIIDQNAQHYNITWSVNGTETTTDVVENEEIDFAAPENVPAGYSFVGWVEEEIDGVVTDAPTYVTEATATADKIYYAVLSSGEMLAQTLTYDGWTYSGATTGKNGYRLFGEDAYVESAEFDLSTLSKVVIYGGRFGQLTDQTATGEITDGTNLWKTFNLTGTNNARKHEFTGGTGLSGTGKLRIASTCGDGENMGLRISKIEIYTKELPETYYFTTIPEKVQMNITSAMWATYVPTEDVLFPSEVKAYVVTNVSEGNATATQVESVTAGTPVIVNGDAGTHTLIKYANASAPTANMLLVSDGTVTGDGTIYVLAVQEDATGKVAGFAPLKEGKTLSEGKAYLQAVNAGAKINFVIDGEATDIRNIENAVDFSDGDWYNLQGVKVTNPQRGIYIHNGKKVVIK